MDWIFKNWKSIGVLAIMAGLFFGVKNAVGGAVDDVKDFFGGVFGGTGSKVEKRRAINKKIVDILVNKYNYGLAMATMWTMVSIAETADYTSNLFVNHHNLFGMKHPKKRKTTSIGQTSSGFASYNTEEEAILDLVYYMQEFDYPSNFTTPESQLKFMKAKGYFEEPYEQYWNLLQAWYQKILKEHEQGTV